MRSLNKDDDNQNIKTEYKRISKILKGHYSVKIEATSVCHLIYSLKQKFNLPAK
ncbi:hypothetical protein GCM10007916_16600 [Psychromonas marina]|uniref:Uncharacterized protein n=1 Tax=Psychromonas marina TaxID=88364 RepID=A0ABQ6E029_9GAMM|nr:hypothetical protein GCM10007916_16600 [Psychromonas marina]